MCNEIQDIKTVFVVIQNTDLTEGRGRLFPLHVCETKTTANRLAKGHGVMGSNCPVVELLAVKYKNEWMYPSNLVVASKEDIKEEKRISERAKTVKKALSLGMTNEEIELMAGK